MGRKAIRKESRKIQGSEGQVSNKSNHSEMSHFSQSEGYPFNYSLSACFKREQSTEYLYQENRWTMNKMLFPKASANKVYQ